MFTRDWKMHWLIPAAAIVQPLFAADYLSVTEAQKVLFPKADSFEARHVKLTDAQVDTIKSESGVRQRNHEPQIWRAVQGGKDLGHVFVDEVIGKHENITYAAALSIEGRVLGVEILSYRETKGGEVRSKEWLKHFEGKTLKDSFKLDEDVPNISGATLSCRNLLDGVKRLLVLQKVIGNG